MRNLATRIKQSTGLSRGRVWQVQGSIADAGDLSVCFAGTEAQKNFIKYLFFREGGEETDLGIQYFWKFRHCLTTTRRFDLVLWESRPGEIPLNDDGSDWFLPLWLMTFVDIPLPRPGDSLRSDLRKVRNYGFDWTVSRDWGDVKEFYQELYLPYVTLRHDDRSIIMDREELRGAVASGKCELVQVRDQGEVVAGMLIDYRNSLPNLWSVGVLGGRQELFRKCVVPASYQFAFNHLQNLGFNRVTLGYTRPLPGDGVFRFKSKFGPQFYQASGKGLAMLPVRHSLALSSFLVETPFFFYQEQELRLARFVSTPEDRHTLPRELCGAASLGLPSIQCYLTDASQPPRLLEETPVSISQATAHDNNSTQIDSDDWQAAGRYFLRQVLNVTCEKSLLLYSDSASDPDTVDLIQSAAEAMGVSVKNLVLDSGCTLETQSASLVQILQNSEFDLLCETSGQYFYNTPAWQLARDRGIRTYALGALSRQAFLDCVAKADPQRLELLAATLEQQLRDCSEVAIRCNHGTDLRIRMKRPAGSRLLAALGLQRPGRSRVFPAGGALSEATPSAFLAGQLAFMGFHSGIEGKLIVDGYLWPPADLGRLQSPVSLTLQGGHIVRVEGGEAAARFARWLPPDKRQLKHICIGFNPGAGMQGCLLEAERVYGACSFGFGDYPRHTDGVVSQVSLTVDGSPLIKDGIIPGWDPASLRRNSPL